eukprot:PhM_4_TR1255/c2_g1_i8/m.81224/K04905/KCNH2; potassium voltage-gated channel Eag-related subfamily H member 2
MSTSDDFTLPIGGVPHQATDDSDVMDDFDPDAYRLQSEKGNSGGRGDSCETGENSQRDLLSHQSRLTGEARVVEGPQQGDDDDDDDNQSTTRQGIQRSNTNQTSDLELEMKTDSESGQTPQHPLDPPRSSGSNRKEDEVEIEMNEPSTSQTTNNNNEEVVEGETVISDGVKTMTPTERTPEMKPLIDGDDEGSTAPPPAPPPPPPPPPAAAPPAPSFMDRFRLVAKKYFSSAVVRNRVSKSKRLTRMYTVMSTTKELVLPPDSIVGRYWYIIVALCAAVEFISFTRCLVFDNTFSRSELVIHFVTCFVNIVDAFLHIQRIVVTKRHRAFCIVDVISAAPLEIILFFDPTTHAVRSLISGCRACKIVAVPEMFGRSMPDAIDVDYVNFYYRWLPTALFIFWFLLFLHTLVIIRLLCAEKSESYHDAITWVWILLTSAPLSLDDVTSLPEQILSGFLMTASMILQGYVVGAMSMLVFSYNVKDENRTQMLVTLEMLKHYQLPVEVQHEVLSFQYHILEDSGVRGGNQAVMDKLPPTMLRQIQLYVKVDILNKVKLFDAASQECKLQIADAMEQRVIEPDDGIIVAGDIGEGMYFMLHGLADVILPNGLRVATIRRGDFFGEIALLSPDSKRKATVMSLTYCDLLELHRDDFEAVIEDFPEFLDKILEKREDEMRKQAAQPPPAPPEDDRSSLNLEDDDADEGISIVLQSDMIINPDDLDVQSTRGDGIIRIARNAAISRFVNPAPVSIGSGEPFSPLGGGHTPRGPSQRHSFSSGRSSSSNSLAHKPSEVSMSAHSSHSIHSAMATQDDGDGEGGRRNSHQSGRRSHHSARSRGAVNLSGSGDHHAVSMDSIIPSLYTGNEVLLDDPKMRRSDPNAGGVAVCSPRHLSVSNGPDRLSRSTGALPSTLGSARVARTSRSVSDDVSAGVLLQSFTSSPPLDPPLPTTTTSQSQTPTAQSSRNSSRQDLQIEVPATPKGPATPCLPASTLSKTTVSTSSTDTPHIMSVTLANNSTPFPSSAQLPHTQSSCSSNTTNGNLDLRGAMLHFLERLDRAEMSLSRGIRVLGDTYMTQQQNHLFAGGGNNASSTPRAGAATASTKDGGGGGGAVNDPLWAGGAAGAGLKRSNTKKSFRGGIFMGK